MKRAFSEMKITEVNQQQVSDHYCLSKSTFIQIAGF